MEDKPKMWYGPCGSLVCDREIDGITQKLTDGPARYYGGPYVVGEAMSRSACEKIAGLLGGEFVGAGPKNGKQT